MQKSERALLIETVHMLTSIMQVIVGSRREDFDN